MTKRSSKTDMFYTYIWRGPDGVPFYVGKGIGRRAYETGASRSKEFKDIISLGCCTVEIVDQFILESQAHAHEIELIAQYGRRDLGVGPLVNKTDGGEGASGAILSEEHLKALADANIGNKYTLGRVLSEEHRSKIRKAMMGNTHMLGKTLPQETRAKLSAALKGIPKSEKIRANLAHLNSIRIITSETKAKISAALAGKSLSAEHVAKVKAGMSLGGPRRGEFKGVSLHKAARKWVAEITIDRKKKYLGLFPNAVEAARAYDAAAIAAFGVGNCYLNFPPAANDNEPASVPVAA